VQYACAEAKGGGGGGGEFCLLGLVWWLQCIGERKGTEEPMVQCLGQQVRALTSTSPHTPLLGGVAGLLDMHTSVLFLRQRFTTCADNQPLNSHVTLCVMAHGTCAPVHVIRFVRVAGHDSQSPVCLEVRKQWAVCSKARDCHCCRFISHVAYINLALFVSARAGLAGSGLRDAHLHHTGRHSDLTPSVDAYGGVGM
jgi:hypothetical protein